MTISTHPSLVLQLLNLFKRAVKQASDVWHPMAIRVYPQVTSAKSTVKGGVFVIKTKLKCTEYYRLPVILTIVTVDLSHMSV